MVNIVYSPQWFYGKDIIIDTISIVILLLIAFFSIRYYNYKKNRNNLYLALSFSLLAISFLFKILMNFTIYYRVFETRQLGFITLTYHGIQYTNILFFIGFLLYRLLTLLGLYILYSIYESQSKPAMFFIVYLILVSTYLSQSAYYIFHLTSLILLVLITMQYSSRYLNKKYITTKMLAYSFGVITLSQIFFMFVELNTQLYVIGEIIQLAGYIILLGAFITVLRHGRKTNKS